MRVSVHTGVGQAAGGADAGGLHYLDDLSGCRVRVGTPAELPELWRRYVDGALVVYRHYGVEDALDIESIADGRTTAMFLVAQDPDGTVVAGLRAHGPHRTADEIAGFQPWLGAEGERELRAAVAERVPAGVIETKGAWSTRERPRRPELGELLARGIVHLAWLLDARYVFGASPLHRLELYGSSGAQQPPEIPAVNYPDDRYVTVPIWWDLEDLSTATPSQRELVNVERAQLATTRVPAGNPELS